MNAEKKRLEEGIAGICDERQLLCCALALWNGRDPILNVQKLCALTQRLFPFAIKLGNAQLLFVVMH